VGEAFFGQEPVAVAPAGVSAQQPTQQLCAFKWIVWLGAGSPNNIESPVTNSARAIGLIADIKVDETAESIHVRVIVRVIG
jgi:hypothetical protein